MKGITSIGAAALVCALAVGSQSRADDRYYRGYYNPGPSVGVQVGNASFYYGPSYPTYSAGYYRYPTTQYYYGGARPFSRGNYYESRRYNYYGNRGFNRGYYRGNRGWR